MSESFKEWIDSLKEESRKYPNSWDAWSKAAIKEIDKVIEHNDTGQKPKITMKMLLERLENRYEIATTDTTIRRYLQKELGRKGWKG